MTTRNFRVNSGLSVGAGAWTVSTEAITGVDAVTLSTTTAPTADGELSNKKYVDDQISAISSTSITSGSTNVTVAGTSATTTVSGSAALTINATATRVHGNLIVDGTRTELNTAQLSVEDNIIELNRGISANSGMPTYTGLKVQRGETSSATEEDLWWVWDESFADDGTTLYGNAGGAWTALRGQGSAADITSTEANLVDIRANVVHATSTSASYSDVAERFEADAPMAEGAVVSLGGNAEITETVSDLQDDVFGVVSTKPAYAMNVLAGNSDSHPFVAMTGRTPVRVSGLVSKGQRLVASSVKGTARAVATNEAITPFHVIGRALESKTDAGIGLVNCVVRTNN